MEESLINLVKRAELLRSISVFSALSDEAVNKLSALLVERKTRAQEPLFKKGEQGENMYILAEGEVRVHDGNHVIARLGAGEVFGEYALFDTENRSASVTTEKKCLILILGRDALMNFLKEYPEMLLGMLQVQIKRMRDMNELEDKLSKSYLKISKQKQEIEKQHEAIKDQKATLENQNKSLEELNEQKKQLLSIIIHGLKNPLTSVRSMAEMISSDQQLCSDTKEYASILIHAVQRIDLVINDMIRTNQAEVYQAEKMHHRMDMKQLLSEFLAMKQVELNKLNLKIILPDLPFYIDKNEASVNLLADQLLEWIFAIANQKQTIEIVFSNSERAKSIQFNFKPLSSFQSSFSLKNLTWWQIISITANYNFEKIAYAQNMFDQHGYSVAWNYKNDHLFLNIAL